MKRINLYSLLIRVHVLLIGFTVIGSLYVIAIGQPNWLIAFLTVPLINLILIPITKKGEKFDPTHPMLMILASLLIGTVFRSFFIISPLQSDAKFLMLMGKPPTILLKGIAAIYLGFICLILGYTYPTKPLSDWSRKPIFSHQLSVKKLVIVAVLLTLTSLVAAALYFKKMGVNFSVLEQVSQKRHYQVDEGSFSSLGYYRLLMDLIEPLFFIFLMYIIQKKKPIWSLLGMFTFLLGFLNMAYPFIQSSRTNALYVLINTGLVIYYLKGGIKMRQLVTVAGIACVALVIMTNFRETHSKVRSQTEETNPFIIMVGSLNFLGVDKTSQIMDNIPVKMNYQLGESLVLWLLAPIPRTMWPQKPEMTYGRVIGEKIYEKRDENSPGGGVPPGFVAEMYLNFGYLGIIGGLFVFGLLLKLCYNAFRKIRGTSIFAMVVYILAFAPFPLKIIGGDFSGCVVQIFSAILTSYLIIKLVQKKPEV